MCGAGYACGLQVRPVLKSSKSRLYGLDPGTFLKLPCTNRCVPRPVLKSSTSRVYGVDPGTYLNLPGTNRCELRPELKSSTSRLYGVDCGTLLKLPGANHCLFKTLWYKLMYNLGCGSTGALCLLQWNFFHPRQLVCRRCLNPKP